ncbi:hypothetical protein HG530_000829 [Fusarium avenaceum]|nr:hypothetical protein HG530_000829 [Fusarium avenaceum]
MSIDNPTPKAIPRVVKVRKKEEDGQQGDDAQKHGTSRTLATGALIHLTSTVSAKGWQAHEATANHIGNAKCDHLSVGTQLNTLDGLARAQTLCSYRGLEESKKSNEKRCRHGASDMRHVFQLEWPLESQQLAVSSLDCSENFNPLAFPVKLPAENRRHDNNHKSIRNISNARERSAEHTVHETQSRKASDDNHCARHTSDNTADLRVQHIVVFVFS